MLVPSPQPAPQRRRAFTLVELLVVIAIIGVLVALLLPAVQAAREAARRSQCSNNLKQVGIAFHNFHDVRNAFPPLRIAGAEGWASCWVLVLPYMEQNTIYDQWDITRKYAEQSVVARQTQVKSYYCPARRPPTTLSVSEQHWPNDPTPPPTPSSAGNTEIRFSANNNPPGCAGDYAACVGDMRGTPNNPNSENWFNVSSNGAIIIATPQPAPANPAAAGFTVNSWNSNTRFSLIEDGTSNTFLAGEKQIPAKMFGRQKIGDGPIFSGSWSAIPGRIAGLEDPLSRGPADITPSGGAVDGIYARKFGSWHPGICQFVFCDGSTRMVRVTIDSESLRRLAVRNDGESISLAD